MQINDETVSLATAKEENAAGQEFSHLQKSHTNKINSYRLIITSRNSTFLSEQTITLATVDGNEIYAILGTSCYVRLQKWILPAFRSGSNVCFIAVAHGIAHAMGSVEYVGLPFFHSFTGCDTVEEGRNLVCIDCIFWCY